MIWEQKGTRWLSYPYQILYGVRCYESWIHSDKKYAVLARDVQTLDAAKAVCAKHKAIESVSEMAP